MTDPLDLKPCDHDYYPTFWGDECRHCLMGRDGKPLDKNHTDLKPWSDSQINELFRIVEDANIPEGVVVLSTKRGEVVRIINLNAKIQEQAETVKILTEALEQIEKECPKKSVDDLCCTCSLEASHTIAKEALDRVRGK